MVKNKIQLDYTQYRNLNLSIVESFKKDTDSFRKYCFADPRFYRHRLEVINNELYSLNKLANKSETALRNIDCYTPYAKSHIELARHIKDITSTCLSLDANLVDDVEIFRTSVSEYTNYDIDFANLTSKSKDVLTIPTDIHLVSNFYILKKWEKYKQIYHIDYNFLQYLSASFKDNNLDVEIDTDVLDYLPYKTFSIQSDDLPLDNYIINYNPVSKKLTITGNSLMNSDIFDREKLSEYSDELYAVLNANTIDIQAIYDSKESYNRSFYAEFELKSTIKETLDTCILYTVNDASTLMSLISPSSSYWCYVNHSKNLHIINKDIGENKNRPEINSRTIHGLDILNPSVFYSCDILALGLDEVVGTETVSLDLLCSTLGLMYYLVSSNSNVDLRTADEINKSEEEIRNTKTVKSENNTNSENCNNDLINKSPNKYNLNVYDIAIREVSLIRKMKNTSNSGSSGSGTSKSPHVRRAHFHKFWVGKRGTSERKKVVKFLSPMLIHGDKLDDVPAIITQNKIKTEIPDAEETNLFD